MRTILLSTLIMLNLYVNSKNVNVIQKEIVRLLQVNPNTLLNIQNHNGDISFELWQKNEVEIKVIIEVESPKVKFLNRYIEAILIHEIKNGDEHTFISKVDPSKLDMSFRNGRSKYRINYFVKHPVYLNVNIQNKNGDILFDEISGNISVKLSYGKLNIKNLTSDETKKLPKIILTNAKAYIQKTEFLDAELNNSKLIINDAKSLIINSSYSVIDLHRTHYIKINSRYDNYYISDVTKILLKSKFSEIKISQIISYADISVNYGSIVINKITGEFSEGVFDINYSNLNIKLSYDACLKIDSHVIYGDIILPKRSNVDNYISLKDKKVSGIIGCISGAKSKFDIKAEFSDIVISD